MNEDKSADRNCQQILWTKAQAIAQTYPADIRNNYVAAALALRLPYWDWTMHPALPDAVQYSSVKITTPDGPQLVENPLFDYNFQGNADFNGFPRDRVPLADFPYTVRHLDYNTQQSNQSAVNAELLANAGHVMSSTYTLFTQVTDYLDFSCVAPNGQSNTGNNLEILHGFIHNAVGGLGHMTWPEVSAFDPIFWLHHANVDRLFAMWQVLNPNSYFGPAGALNVFGSFYEPPGSVDTGSSSLAPFHADDGSYLYTNDAVRSITTFNYGYLDVPDWDMNGTQLVSYVRAQINSKYNPPAQQQQRSNPQRPISLLQAFSNVGIDVSTLGSNNAETQWTISVLLNQFAFKTAFSIAFFMGPPPADIRTWSTAPCLVGTHAQFMPSNITAMFPTAKPTALSRGELSLTHTLLAGVNRGLLPDLSPAAVVPVLQAALTWRARTPEGYEVDLAELEGLSIAVGSRKTTPTTRSDRFPSYDPVIWHPEATVGKVGGAKLRRIGRRLLT
jgi:tyrosinase